MNLYLPNSFHGAIAIFPPSLKLLSALSMDYSLTQKSVNQYNSFRNGIT
ncbi:hypothetical protein PPL_06652 [Heterostelium album PN500]|uniref:Uncharacterized protein n=1 Tax=Heterostelium pallidum (strain ATCC 26659 / Pp 5 / PN500) TaxID=670386 RepID=D3BFB9_HETP5|nr:hypothetical protein PPL_06652 [Heterostelium album PN500]EFA79833.1 hypothetical protein PPL_06652 [Heterostelium album PN500]|eukprot:XP_020431954.1 hypothetical protein PPL_06652 [Heterostelium album PN500]